ncbi:MAG TPA: hypothetical protein P5076_18840, partial [Myxococcota bacterium]|nr:hypothetical protein [Myxococcota bacterium]
MKSWFLLFAMFFSACGSAGTVDGPWTDGPNPFLDPTLFRSAASYRELEVSLEAELESPGWELLFAPGDALWFAATELRRRHGLELGFPADEALEPARLEWLLDGRWLPTSQVAPSDWLRLRRFRLGAHAWAFGLAAQLVQPGQAYELQVPARAYRLLEDAGASCAEGGQLPPAGTYWSVWAPELPGCQAPLATLSLRVERLAPASPAAYPEYDALRVDGQLRAAAVFLPDPAEGTDPRAGSAWAAAEALCADLLDAGFAEQPGLARGRRFTRAGASLALSVDVLFPDRLAAMGDPAAVLDWRRAFAGAEVLLMIGPAALPAGFAFSELELPAGYQVVLATSQLEPDLLVRPLAAGGYGRLDLLTTARALSGAEPRALARGLLAGLLRGAAGEDLHWPQLLAGVERLGGAPLVASGVSTNCFTPAGTRCAE